MRNLNNRLIRPAHRIALSRTDIYWEGGGLLLLISYWVFLHAVYPHLSNTIPSHFDIGGNADAYESKSSVWSLPKVATVLYVLLTVCSFFPRYFNYGVEITKDNAEKEYKSTFRLIRYLKFIVIIIF